mgnify:CR=1 FL=1
MIKSPNDKKQYLPHTLKNGLRVLLIENHKHNKAAAALAVNAGHFDDPKHREGLAHFVEHMLFLGTQKYPDGSEYQKFISSNGGTTNAWTATEHTCFFFDIQHIHFEEALDRFSQFFIAPLLSQEFIEKERQNVDAEFKLKLKDDIRRLYDVHKETINPEHPFSKFSVGNNFTLGDEINGSIRESVCDFVEEHYYAENITLVLEGPQSLEELKSMSETYFSQIKSNNKTKEKVSVPLYLPEHLQKQLMIKPVKDDKQLIISFAMPSIDKYYRNKPDSLIAYLLGYEGKGSILSLLKTRQWATTLTAGSGVNGSNFKDFNISISLTKNGENYIDEIVAIVLNYIDLLKDKPLAEHYYQEKQSIAGLSFKYQEKSSPIDTVSQLVLNMHHYSEKYYVFGDFAMEGLILEDFNELLNYLRVDNMRLIHISHSNEFDKESKWYKVPYAIKPFNQLQLQKWQTRLKTKSLYLPAPNPYIVADPQVIQSTENNNIVVPQLIKNDDGLKVWFKKDRTFNVPKGYVYIGLDTPMSIQNTANIAMTKLFVDIYSDAIIEEHYDAELAGIHYHLYSHQGGISLQMSGLSEKQHLLIDRVLASLKKVSFTEDKFNLLKTQIIEHWQNTDKSKSISQLFSVLSSSLQPSNPSSNSLIRALKNITFSEFKEFCSKLTQEVALTILIHGNWQEDSALEISDTITNALTGNCSDLNLVNVPILDIQSQGKIALPLVVEEHDHAAITYFPMHDKTPTTIAKTILTSQLLSPLFFQVMRTEKQLGYLVGVGYVPVNNFPGIALYIQSPHTQADKLTKEIYEFLINSISELSSMSSNDWNNLKHGLASQLKENDASLRARSQRFWGAICNDDTKFKHKTDIIEAILSLKFEEIIDFINKQISPLSTPDLIELTSFPNEQLKLNCKFEGKIIDNPEKMPNLFKRK